MSDYQAACKVEFQPFGRSYSQLTFMKNNVLVPMVYFVSPNAENIYTQPNPTNKLTHAINIQGFSGVFDAGGCSYHMFHVFPAEVRSATPQLQALQLDLRRVNERNRKLLSRAIHVIFSSPKIGEVECEISSKEHEGPSSLLLKAPHIYILDTKDILFSAVLLLLPLSHKSDRLWAFFLFG